MNDRKEHWNSLLTEKSWQILQELRKKYDFILIGGWAAYLLAKQQKSKDIDIAVSLNELEKLKREGAVKNDRLKKYEIKNEDIDTDIYVEYYSEIALPIEGLKKYAIQTQGFKVVGPEALLVLKQGAYENRKNSVKGEKDKIDIVSILFFTGIELRKYNEILSKYKLESYRQELKRIIKDFKDYDALNMKPAELKKKKEKALAEL